MRAGDVLTAIVAGVRSLGSPLGLEAASSEGGPVRFALLVCTDESAVISDEERSRRVTACTSFEDHMRERGVLLASERLHATETATTVRCWDGGDVVVADGPFAETKEQISGFFILECKNLDEAVDVAAGVPAAWYGTIEVRPVWEK
jgi:hypothetical protein